MNKKVTEKDKKLAENLRANLMRRKSAQKKNVQKDINGAKDKSE